MILFDLRCAREHVFEGWFRDGDAYEAQAAAHEIVCPVCGDATVAKAPMSPAIAGGAREAPRERTRQVIEGLKALRAHVEANFDHVGPRFAEEARRIHYGEAEHRDIYGTASDQEAAALGEEGITVGRLPWLPRHDG